MEDAESLEDAAMLCLSNVADFIVPDTPVHTGSSTGSREQKADDSFDDW